MFSEALRPFRAIQALIVGAWLLGLCPGTGFAAEITPTESEYCDFNLTGEIKSGDFNRFVELGYFNTTEPWRSSLFGHRLCLDSPGGSIVEGLQIFDGIWNTGVITVVPPGKRCESSCALVFLGGGSLEGARGTRFSRRYIFPTSILGFHAPGLNLPRGGQFTETEVIGAFDIAISASSTIMGLLDVAWDEVRPINTHLLQRILSTPPNKMYFVNSLLEAALTGIDVIGIPVPNFSHLEVENICDAAYLRTFGSTYVGAQRAETLRAGLVFNTAQRVISQLHGNALWRSSNIPFAERRVSVSNEEITSGSGETYIGSVSGYPGYQGHLFLCLVSVPTQIDGWSGRSLTSQDFRHLVDFDYTANVDFFAYRFHDGLEYLSEELPVMLMSSYNRNGMRFAFVERSKLSLAFTRDLTLDLNNFLSVDGDVLRSDSTTSDIESTFGVHELDGALGPAELPACWLTSPNARVINVTEYVNLRRQPDFSAPVVRQVPLGERLRAQTQTAYNITIIGQDRDRQSCISACQAFGADPEDRTARDRAQQCINDNMLWYEITDASRNRGWVSRKFLEEVE